MLEKIFNALKTKYAALGLGDSFLEAYAASMEKTKLVTDENLENMVAMQETALKAIQSGLDKRATDARNDADKKAKIEQDKVKAELAKAQKAYEDAMAEVERVKAEAEKLKTKEIQPPTPPAPEKENEAPKSEQTFDAEGLKTALMAQFTEQMKVQMAELKTASEKAQKSLADKIATLTAENEQFKADKAKADAERMAAERAKFISDTATSLGIPEWRQKEGFVIAPEADNAAITATLTTISENLRANALPASGIKGANNSQNPVKLDTEKVANLAASIVSKSMY